MHKIRLPWLEKNAEGFVRAIISPDFAEKKLRFRKDGHYSITHIVELYPGEKDEERFMIVAISLSKNATNGYHQVTTIHPATWRNVFKPNGDLREKYIKLK